MRIENIYNDLLEIFVKFENLKNSKEPLSCCSSNEKVLNSFVKKIFTVINCEFPRHNPLEKNIEILEEFILNSRLDENKKIKLIKHLK